MSTNREQTIEYLTEDWGGIGISREDAEARLRDGDLWFIEPERRYGGANSEEAIREWSEAADFARSLAEGFSLSSALGVATQCMLWDMCERAEEALRRARERAQA
jgi:hypothetical protein